MVDYLSNNKQKFIDELIDFLKIPSVSTHSHHQDDVRKAAEFVKTALLEAGADEANLVETKGHPIVFGQKIMDTSLPTVLVYGHYDVQPPDPLDLWDSPPFEPVIKDEKIYARGASDDKGQMYMHIKALEILKQNGGVPCNLKFMFEGEEEVGSDNLEPFLKENKDKLQADVVLISDTSTYSLETPTITTGLRGISYMEVEVTGPNRDLHSGVYGGAVANPINVLCEMITSLKDENGHITIPNFYEDVEEVTAEEREAMAKIPFSDAAYQNDLGVKGLMGEKGYTTLERASIRPTLDVNGIWGGYMEEGAKTVIASKAHAKISMRLVPNQSNEKISQLFTEHFQKIAPAGVQVKVIPHHGGEPAVTPTNMPAYQAASKAFEEVFGKTPIPKREGGSIPIVALFEEELNIKTVLLGFGFDSDAIHSPNEHYGLENYLKGIETIARFHQHFAQMA